MENFTGSSLVLPVPGVVWGAYPERRADARAPRGALTRDVSHQKYSSQAAHARLCAQKWAMFDTSSRIASLAGLRARLRREGLVEPVVCEALGCMTDALRRTLDIGLFNSQLFAAAILLDGQLAEMATGEGKTYAAAAAAAVAALAGAPVHVITANQYLATRDAQALAPFYAALGLTVGTIEQSQSGDQRRAVYRADVVYCTAREIVFDYLRDRQTIGRLRTDIARRAAELTSSQSPPPLLRGLCVAIIDEADSVLLDDATMPLILSESVVDPQHRAFLWQALGIARQLSATTHYTIDARTRTAELTQSGRERLTELAVTLDASWHSERRRNEVVSTALAALHAYHIDHDYLVREGRVEILDQVTGRAAPGRVWSRGLQGLIELKEKCRVTGDTRTIAQITYQRFFPRYLRLSGMSGTLREARGELRATYGLEVVRVPLRKPSRRTRLPDRLFPDDDSRWAAVAERISRFHTEKRPVLVGTDSVADSETLSHQLSARGIAHEVLNARHDSVEASIIAHAGSSGAVTVSTNMAGRGTDIVLEADVAARGGLHVMCCQHNGARRLDRQIEGRAARQGDPGSVETWLALDAGLFRRSSWLGALVRRLAGLHKNGVLPWPRHMVRAMVRWPQWMQERRDAAQRRRLALHEREWDRRATFAPPVE